MCRCLTNRWYRFSSKGHRRLRPSPDSTYEEEEPAQEDFFNDSLVKEAVTGTDDEDSSPPPTNKARRLQASKASPQIWAPQEPPLPSSIRHISPPSGDAVQEPKDKKDKKSTKERSGVGSNKDDRDKAKGTGTLKRGRNDGDTSLAVDKPATKKSKLKGAKVDAVAIVRATPAVRKRGPGFSKPPPVTNGISGGGFGESVHSLMKPIENGLKEIGVLVVDEDYGNFVKVDGRLWNKDVAPFVGEKVSLPFVSVTFIKVLP
ncbi:hypothetical protein IW262DRAFT_529008 [Armillaria fumosa]|nr:hypothetical protein IW262DRAFT_529008 [Armillaria fumosa]